MIETRQLTKRYGDLVAVDGISFKLEPGRVLGFLGPNGAGKSTTMKMIAGFLAPTSGSASVCAHDVVEDAIAAKRVVGYLPEGAPSYGEMTPRRFLEFVADVRGLAGAKRTQRLDDVIERLHLNGVLEQPIETLSKGFKRRVGLAQAIVHGDKPPEQIGPAYPHYSADTALEVYRNNYRGNLHDALAGAYPVIRQLVGDEFFRYMARKFIEQYPSRSGNLHRNIF